MATFIHHPDGMIIINGTIYPAAFWALAEPDYTLTDGAIGREYEAGERNNINYGSKTRPSANGLTDSGLDAYIAKKASYDTALAAWENGAAISNVGGTVTVKSLTLSTDDVDDEVDADNLDEIIITVTASESTTDDVTWTVYDPSGNEIRDETEPLVAGEETMPFETGVAGEYRFVVSSENFGTAELIVRGVTT